MRYLVVILLISRCFITTVQASTRIFYEDCEDTDFRDHFLERSYGTHYRAYWEEMLLKVTRSQLSPHMGSYCAMWNAWSSRSYGTTMGIGDVTYGNTSNFDIAESLGSKTTLYVKFWMRWQENIDYSGSAEHKLLYVNLNGMGDFVFVLIKNGATSFHLTGKSQSPYELRENHWIRYSGNNLDDMQWHKIEVYMDWEGIGAAGVLWVKIDDNILVERSDWYYRDEDEIGADVQVIGVPSNVSGSPSGDAVEWWDDIEIWDGLPNSKDVNQDGQVNISDVQVVVNVILGNAANDRADVNGDERVTISDVQEVVNGVIG